MAISNLVSTLLMGVFLVAVLVFIHRIDRRAYAPPREVSGSRLAGLVTGIRDSQVTWILVFLAVTFLAGAVAVIGAGGAAMVSIGSPVLVFAALLGIMLVVYVLWGAYLMAKSHGIGNAGAVAVSAWLAGLLFAVAIVAKLVGL